MQKITPCLWFDGKAEQAVKFYTSIFKNSRTGRILRCGDSGPGPTGSVLTSSFELDGQEFLALNGGPMFKFTHAISFIVNCDTQEEINYFWEKLSEGGQLEQCGWLRDKFGVSWQIVPTILQELIQDKDPQKVETVMKALLQMVKLDISTLQNAFNGN